MSKSRSMVMQMLLDDSDDECDEQINVAAVAAGTALLVAHANKRLKHGGSVAGGDRVGQEGQAISAKAKDDSKKLPSASGKFGEIIERVAPTAAIWDRNYEFESCCYLFLVSMFVVVV
ncbi:hypothetical protein TB2_021775 [Malus domestica]